MKKEIKSDAIRIAIKQDGMIIDYGYIKKGIQSFKEGIFYYYKDASYKRSAFYFAGDKPFYVVELTKKEFVLYEKTYLLSLHSRIADLDLIENPQKRNPAGQPSEGALNMVDNLNINEILK